MKQIIRDNSGFSLIAIASAALVLFAAAGAGVFYYFNIYGPARSAGSERDAKATATQQSVNRLPGEDGLDSGNSDEDELVKAEKLTFADFFKHIDEKIEVKENFALPINVKTDVANYYHVARLINLEKQVADLNAKGMAVIENQFAMEARDFYGGYDLLTKKNIPLLLTSDFLIYYYQNTLKNAYDRIKSDIFFEQVWEVNKKMFETADARYKARQAASAGQNDPALEGMKLEAAYFAVALDLLKPRPDQINTGRMKLETGFPQGSDIIFDFTVPFYLTEVIAKETGLIRQAKEKAMSPIFLYTKDYRAYRVPGESARYDKLANFHQAMKWMNSVFPLYYRGDACPECLLDKDDWTINTIAASLIAEDFSKNQEIKNQWAKVYKVISFFEGLRQELSYRQYYEGMSKAFGAGYGIDDIFPTDRTLLEKNLAALQSEAVKSEFLAIEGGFDRQDPSGRARTGMRMLQESYWPDDYVFEQLTYPHVAAYTGDKSDLYGRTSESANNTYCFINREIKRCRSNGKDIVSLIYELPESDLAYKENTKYAGYEEKLGRLKNQITYFSDGTWHNNGFWSALNLARTLFYPEENKGYFDDQGWRARNINTMLGSWVNLHTPTEVLEFRWQRDEIADPSLGSNYIEPNIALVNELLASARMLKEALVVFGATKAKDPAWERIADLAADMEKARDIVKKELAKEELSREDRKAIMNIAEKFEAADIPADRSFNLFFKHDQIGLVENANGIQLAAFVYEQAGKKYMAVGPIFSYREGR